MICVQPTIKTDITDVQDLLSVSRLYLNALLLVIRQYFLFKRNGPTII